MRNANPLKIATIAIMLLGACISVRASETDDRIEAAAKRSHVFKTTLKDDAIKIESRDGAVTLKGTVSEDSHKSLAEDTVKALPGVKSVDNQLEVNGQRPAERSDDWISAKVKAALLFHRSVSSRTQVHVRDGVVTLSGAADSQAEKDLATQYAKDVDGVKSVRNEMTVVTKRTEPTVGDRIDDASITAQVKFTLLTNRSTSAMRTEVETNDGVVTLRGTAKNQAEIDLVTKLVKDIQGVKDVKNEMIVGG